MDKQVRINERGAPAHCVCIFKVSLRAGSQQQQQQQQREGGGVGGRIRIDRVHKGSWPAGQEGLRLYAERCVLLLRYHQEQGLFLAGFPSSCFGAFLESHKQSLIETFKFRDNIQEQQARVKRSLDRNTSLNPMSTCQIVCCRGDCLLHNLHFLCFLGYIAYSTIYHQD